MCHSGHKSQSRIGQRLDKQQGLFPRRKSGITTSIFECRVCGLMYPNPMPIPESLDQHYDVDPEEYWADAYFNIDPEYLKDQIKIFERLTGRAPQESAVLDIGAGIGKAMVAYERAGFDVQGFEPSASFRDAAINRMAISPDRLQLSSIETADYADNSFDFINFAAVLEHLIDPAEALRKTTDWLKPGGVTYVEVPSSAFLLSRLVRLFYQATAADYVINTCPMHVPYHTYEFGLKSFLKHGKKSNYSVAFHDYYPCASYMPNFLIKPFNKVMKSTNTGMQLAVWLKKNS